MQSPLGNATLIIVTGKKSLMNANTGGAKSNEKQEIKIVSKCPHLYLIMKEKLATLQWRNLSDATLTKC